MTIRLSTIKRFLRRTLRIAFIDALIAVQIVSPLSPLISLVRAQDASASATPTIESNQDIGSPSGEVTPVTEGTVSADAASPTPSASPTATPGEASSGDISAPIIGSWNIELQHPFEGSHPISYHFGEVSDHDYVARMQSLFGVEAHDGIDYAMDEGTAIRATDDGVVVSADTGVYGLTIVIKHSWGTSYYGHLSQVSVTAGQSVTRGESIGFSGKSGIVTGPHLHFGIQPTSPNYGNGFHGKIDPAPYFAQESQGVQTGKTVSDLFVLAENNLQAKDDTLTLHFDAVPAENTQLHLIDPDGNQQEVKGQVSGSNKDITVEIPDDFVTTPGTYTVEVINPDGTYDQAVFTWGLLAINPNKAVYRPYDKALLSLAVLDAHGEMICDASLTLTISDPLGNTHTLSTGTGTIQRNTETCQSTNPTIEPDYYAEYSLKDIAGTYQVTLSSTSPSALTIHDSFTLNPEPKFDIERIGPTRIYPRNILPMAIHVTPFVDYQGSVIEPIPSGFEIQPEKDGDLSSFLNVPPDTMLDSGAYDRTVTHESIEWKVDWRAGESYTLHYFYDAPDISPALYNLGPLSLTGWTEPRSWQIANDAVSMATDLRYSTVGFELQSTTAGVEYTTSVGSPAIDTTTYRSGAASFEVLVSGSAATEGLTYNFITANANVDVYLRSYIYISTLPSTQTKIMVFQDSTPSDQSSIRLNTDGTLELWNEEDSAQIGSDSTALSTGRWYRLEMRTNFNGASSSAEARIDGVSFASGSANFANGILTYALGFVTTAATGEVNFDDVTATRANVSDTNWPGEGRIVHLKPNGDGSNTCTSGTIYANIDEITPNDATDTVTCDANNDAVTVQVEDSSTAGIPNNANIIYMATGYRWSGLDTSQAHAVRGGITVGGSLENATTVSSTTATYYTNNNLFNNYQYYIYDWTPANQVRRITTADVDAATATFATTDANPDTLLSTLWIAVEYSVPEGGRQYSSGFELQSAATGMEWTTATGSLDIDTTTIHAGAASLRVQTLSSGTEESVSQQYTYANNDGPYFARSYIYITTAPSAENRILEMKNTGGTAIAYLTIDNTRTLKLYDEDGQVTGTATVPATTWTRLEIKVDATGSGSTDTVEARMDGNTFAASTTRNLSTGTATIVVGGNLNGEAQTTGDWYFDDVAVNMKGVGAYQTDYPGDGKITHLRPNATGDNSAWAVNVAGCTSTDYTCIDEITPNDGTDAVGTSTLAQIEDVNLDSATTGGLSYFDQVNVLSVGIRSANSSTGQNDVRVRLKPAASSPSIEGESIMTTSTSYSTGRTGLAGSSPLTVYTKPLVNTLWTPLDLDSTQIGVRESLDSANNLAVTALWLLVEYSTPSGGRVYSSGFELNSTTSGIEWVAVDGSPTVQGTTKRSGDYAGQITSLSSGTMKAFRHRFEAANTNGAYFLRAYLRVGTAPSAENRIIALCDTSGTNRVYLTLDGSRQLKLYDEDGSIGSVSSALSTDTWYRIEIKADLTAAGGSQVVEAKIDGAAAFATSSTRNISTGLAQFRIGGNVNSEAQTTGNWYYDDIALNQSSGTSQNSYPGAGSIVHLRPNGDGDTTAWTNGYTNLDEVTPNDATDMVESTTLDQIEEVNLDASSTPGIGSGDTINLVSVGTRFRNDSVTHNSAVRVRLKDAASATQILQSNAIPTFSDSWRTNRFEEPHSSPQTQPYPLTAYKRPDGTNDWTATVLNSTQIGVQMAYDHNSNNIEVSTLWLLVEYIPSGVTTITVAGTANGNNGATVKIAVNGTLQGQTGTIGSGTWSIASVVSPAGGDIVTVWVDGATGDNEATGVTKYSTGDINGMVLNNSVLTIGSDQDLGVTVSDLNSYDCTQNEDIMHQAASSHLKVEGDACAGSTTNTYTSEKLDILTGDSLTISGTETLTTYDVSFAGTLTSSGNSTYNIAHDWTKTGTFTSSTSTVNLTGGGGTTQTISGATSFYNLTATGSSARTIKFPSSTTTTVTGTLSLSGAASQLLTLDPSSASTVWTVNPSAGSASYVSVSYSTNSGSTFCASNSTDGGNNTNWTISATATCSSSVNSFQRKTWHDGTRYWRSFYDMSDGRIEFEYSSDGSSWTEDTSARITTSSADYSITTDGTDLFIAYKTTTVPNTDNLVTSGLDGYWKLNESSWAGNCSTADVTDSSGNGHTGISCINGDAPTTVTGKFGNAANFDGVENYINAGSGFNYTSSFSASYWIALDDYSSCGPGGNSQHLIGTHHAALPGGNGRGWGNYWDCDGIAWELTNSTGTAIQSYGYTFLAPTDGSWHHVTFTYDSTVPEAKLYWDGVDVDAQAGCGSNCTVPSTLYNNGEPLTINGLPYATPGIDGAPGKMDDVRVYNRVLTAAEAAILGQPGYDIETRKATSYPGTSFAWGTENVTMNGESTTSTYQYPVITQDTNSKIWLSSTNVSGSTYATYAVRSTSASSNTAWDTATSLDSNTNSNRFGVIVPRTSGNAQAVWIDGTAIESKNYTSGAWDGSPTSVATGVSGITTGISATGDSSGNVHLSYINSSNQTTYQEYTSSWQTAVTLDSNTGNTSPTISLNTINGDLYAFWIRGNHVYYKKGVSPYASGNWDTSATDWQTTGTNVGLTSNNAGSNKIFAQWTASATRMWDDIAISNTAPNSPTSLAQLTTSDVTISTGGWHNTTSIKFTATASDTDNPDTLYLCVEKDDINTAFSNSEDSCGTGVAYSGSGVTVSVTIASQTDATEYHWQARVKDAAGAYSSWVSYGGNSDTTPGAARDYGIDTTAPTGGAVYDGTSAGVDATLSTTSLSDISANWDSFNNNVSGLNKYQYSIGTSAGATDIKGWTDNGTGTSVTSTSLTLQTSQMYYVNVRAVDNAGNTGGTVSSNGQRVSPSISFSVSPANFTFSNLNAGNSYTATDTTTLTTSTNAYNGYVIRAFVTDYLRSQVGGFTIPDFDGGTYASPGAWGGGNRGYGYTSSDTTIQGSNKFSSGTLYAPFSQTGPGDIIADHTSTVTGSAISNEQFTITHKVQTDAVQQAHTYSTTVVYTATAQY